MWFYQWHTSQKNFILPVTNACQCCPSQTLHRRYPSTLPSSVARSVSFIKVRPSKHRSRAAESSAMSRRAPRGPIGKDYRHQQWLRATSKLNGVQRYLSNTNFLAHSITENAFVSFILQSSRIEEYSNFFYNQLLLIHLAFEVSCAIKIAAILTKLCNH